MKIALTKALGKTTTAVSTLLIIISLLGVLNLAFPDYVGFVNELFGFENGLFGFDKEAMTSLTLGTAGTGTLGLIGRTLKNSFNTQNTMLVATHKAEREVWKKEKDELQHEINEFMEVFAIKQIEQLDNESKMLKKQELQLDFNIAYAKERLNMSDNLVPQEVKKEYQAFLDNANNKDNDIKEVKPIIVVEEIEKVVEVELTPKDIKKRKKVNKQLLKSSDKRIGVR